MESWQLGISPTLNQVRLERSYVDELEVDNYISDDKFKETAGQLYHCLNWFTEGETNSVVATVMDETGYEVWRIIYQYFDPQFLADKTKATNAVMVCAQMRAANE